MHFSGVGRYIDPDLPEQGTVSAGASHTENLTVPYSGDAQNIRGIRIESKCLIKAVVASKLQNSILIISYQFKIQGFRQ